MPSPWDDVYTKRKRPPFYYPGGRAKNRQVDAFGDDSDCLFRHSRNASADVLNVVERWIQRVYGHAVDDLFSNNDAVVG